MCERDQVLETGTAYKKSYSTKPEVVTSFVVAALMIFALHQFVNVQNFPFDAGNYWELSQFSTLLDFPKQIRGVIFPILLFPFRLLEDSFPNVGHFPFRAGSSLVYAWVLVVVLPDIYAQTFGGKVTFARRLLVPFLLCALFPGLMVYPLSDLPALLLTSIAAWLLMKAGLQTVSPRQRHTMLLFAGAFAYAGYNTRSIYVFGVGLLLIGIPILLFRGNTSIKKLGYTATFLAGAVVASLPQVHTNLKNFGTFSPFVQTAPNANQPSLFTNQLLWGLMLQRYETSIARNSPSPTVYYRDDAGVKFLRNAQLDISAFSVSQYIGLALHNPLHVAGIIGRHFVNGLDVRDGTVYAAELSSDRTTIALFNFVVIFVGMTAMIHAMSLKPKWTASKNVSAFWAAYFLGSVAFILPGAVETRFLIPLHISIYASFAYHTNAYFWNFVRRQWIVLTLAFFVLLSIFFAITLNTMSSMQYTWPSLA